MVTLYMNESWIKKYSITLKASYTQTLRTHRAGVPNKHGVMERGRPTVLPCWGSSGVKAARFN
jgi:hypothetical protein